MLPVLRQGVPVFGSAGCPGNLGIPLPFRGVHGGQCACPALGWGRIHILGKLFVASPRGPVSRNPNRPPTHRRTVGLPHGIPRTGYPCPLHRQSLPFPTIYPPKSPRRISQVSPPTCKPSNSFTQPLLPATCCGIAGDCFSVLTTEHLSSKIQLWIGDFGLRITPPLDPPVNGGKIFGATG